MDTDNLTPSINMQEYIVSILISHIVTFLEVVLTKPTTVVIAYSNSRFEHKQIHINSLARSQNYVPLHSKRQENSHTDTFFLNATSTPILVMIQILQCKVMKLFHAVHFTSDFLPHLI